MRILITGGAGYIGSVLVRNLLNSHYFVRIIDRFWFGLNPIKDIIGGQPNLEILAGDVTNLEDLSKAIKDMDAIIHLAAIVGDPACAVSDPTRIFEINFIAPIRLAALAREQNVERFIFASTCSVYGANNTEILSEASTPSPITIYGRTKLEAEKQILLLANDQFSPCILRLATAYGISPRMRFDLAINYITMKAIIERRITILGGNQWRPFIHVSDVARAFQTVLEAPGDKIAGEIFNVGANRDNYQLKEIAEPIKRLIPDVEVIYAREIEDKRSYNVSFDKIHRILGFATTKRVEDGVLEIKDAFDRKIIVNPDDPIYYNHRTLEKNITNT